MDREEVEEGNEGEPEEGNEEKVEEGNEEEVEESNEQEDEEGVGGTADSPILPLVREAGMDCGEGNEEEDGEDEEGTANSPIAPLEEAEVDCEEVEEGNAGEEEARTKSRRKVGKRRYVWCPIHGCMSGPVKMITQHLKQVHKLPPHKVARLNTLENRRYATTKAIEK